MKEKSEVAEHQVEGNVVKLPNSEKLSSEEKPSPKNVHAGHRTRLRNRFLQNGLDSFEDHNALELLLFYAIPNRDVNDLAHNLINEFGSFSGVFEASFYDLCNVKGLSEYSASLIKLIPAIASRYGQDRVSNKFEIYDSPEKYAEYMSKIYIGVTNEILYFLCLDNNFHLIKCMKVCEGDFHKISVNFRKITEAIFKTGASNVVIVHNHPSNVLSPSSDDLMFTAKVTSALKCIDVNVIDHIIMGLGDDYLSMRKNRKWASIFHASKF